jgi:hypothetical protein
MSPVLEQTSGTH